LLKKKYSGKIISMKKKKKKNYKPPKISSKEIFEINALGCGKCPSSSNVTLGVSCIRGVKKLS